MKNACTKHITHAGIDVARSEYRGAPYPAFDPKKINESKFEDGLRAKEWETLIISDWTGEISWKSQVDEDPTIAWEREVKRAFAANGLKIGASIYVKFGARDTGFIHEYEMVI